MNRVPALLSLAVLVAVVSAVGCSGVAGDTTTVFVTPTTTSTPTTIAELVTSTEVADTTTTEAPTTTIESAPTTTTETAITTTGVQVTRESGESPCYIVKILRSGGKDYIVVDYIQVAFDDESVAQITNVNPRLRTFEIPKSAWIGFHSLAVTLGMAEYDDPTETGARGVRGTLADLKRSYGLTTMWWDIKVSDGKVISIVEAWTP